MGPTEKQCRYI